MQDRSYLLQGMDCLGYIPVVGNGVGVIRIIGSIAFVILKEIASQFNQALKEDRVSNKRAGDEAMRGLAEVVGCGLLPLVLDLTQGCGCADWDVASGSKFRVLTLGSSENVFNQYALFGKFTGKQNGNAGIK